MPLSRRCRENAESFFRYTAETFSSVPSTMSLTFGSSNRSFNLSASDDNVSNLVFSHFSGQQFRTISNISPKNPCCSEKMVRSLHSSVKSLSICSECDITMERKEKPQTKPKWKGKNVFLRHDQMEQYWNRICVYVRVLAVISILVQFPLLHTIFENKLNHTTTGSYTYTSEAYARFYNKT